MNGSKDIVLGQTTISLLAYTDDIDILKDNVEIVKELSKKLRKAVGKVDLVINDKKTEYINLSPSNTKIC